MFTLWIAVHMVVGWSPKVSGVPLLAFPASVFHPFVNGSTGKPYFPFSMLLGRTDEESISRYLDPLGDMPGDHYANVPGAGVFVCVGLITSTFVIAKGYSVIRRELLTDKSSFWKVLGRKSKSQRTFKLN